MIVAYHNVDRSESLNSFVEDKMNHLAAFKERVTNVKWMITKERGAYKSVIQFQAYGKFFNIEGKAGNVYASVLKVHRKVKNSFSKRIKFKQRLHTRKTLSYLEES
ncbi:hypothetical protein A9Q84_09965 [Halobacteriovorax marinus]|uniref:Ribosomal subunit interface protein n=1 Tax=Halobacteriovorax marinus TaxID=97084 RepID=A0A1Y5FCJ5_9BACT|nr:hypothetical protein A9Q84_09965 [Halobacteriovorax marinus]